MIAEDFALSLIHHGHGVILTDVAVLETIHVQQRTTPGPGWGGQLLDDKEPLSFLNSNSIWNSLFYKASAFIYMEKLFLHHDLGPW